MIRLGERYRDAVSGWEGIATARYEYMNGCVRYEIGGVDKDGKPESFVFDEQQLVPLDRDLRVEELERVRDEVEDRGRGWWSGRLRRTGGPRDSRPVDR